MLTTVDSPISIKILDETTSGTILNQLKLDFLTAKISLCDLITNRVRTEIENQKQSQTPQMYSLIEGDTDKTESELLNPDLIHKKVEFALEMFQKNGFLVLIDDVQMVDLTQEIYLNHQTQITFLKLIPLIGG